MEIQVKYSEDENAKWITVASTIEGLMVHLNNRDDILSYFRIKPINQIEIFDYVCSDCGGIMNHENREEDIKGVFNVWACSKCGKQISTESIEIVCKE